MVVVVRVLLLLLAAVSVGSAFVLARRPGPSSARFACPMHPEVTARGPGACATCGMALEPLGTRGRTAPAAGAAEVDPRSVDVETIEPRLFTQAVRAPARLEAGGQEVRALLYADERAALAPGELGWFSSTAEPGERIEVRAASAPGRRWDDATWVVPFRVESEVSGRIRPGDNGWLTIPARPRPLRVVTSTAIVDSPEGPALFVAPRGTFAFAKRRVEVGRSFYGVTVVTSAAADGERVATGNAFFLEAERRLSGGVALTAGARR